MLVPMVGIVADDLNRSEAPKAQPVTYVQGSNLKIKLKVQNEDRTAYDLGSKVPHLATALADGTAVDLTFTVTDATAGLAEYEIEPDTVLVPGSYNFWVYLDDGAGAHEEIVSSSVLTVEESSIPTA